VNLALKYNVPKMITISTDKAACPTTLMGGTKFIAERITLNANSLSTSSQVFACVRFGNVANSRGSVIPVYIDNLINNKPLEITNPEVTRFIMEISDAVGLIMKATESAKGGEIFIFKMKAFRLGDLLDVMVNRIAPRLNIKPENVRIDRSSLYLGEKLHEDLFNANESSQIMNIDDMYVIQTHQANTSPSQEPIPGDLLRYNSSDLPRISQEEIEKIVIKYLGERDIFRYV
jgi:UDP-N-acetylglucosamine 4,6-dehydratase/5-epimerase